MRGIAHDRRFDGTGTNSSRDLPGLLARVPQLHLKMEPMARRDFELRNDYGEPIEIVFAVVAVVLLLACGNVASLLRARRCAAAGDGGACVAGRGTDAAGAPTAYREPAPGGRGGRAGRSGGGVDRPGTVRMLAPEDAPVHLPLAIDWRMLAFTALMSIATAVAFGIAPALRASKVEVHAALKSGARLAGGRAARQRPAGAYCCRWCCWWPPGCSCGRC